MEGGFYMRRVYKRNYISNFLIRLDLGTNLEEGKYDDILKLLTNDFPIMEKLDIQNRNILINKDSDIPEPILSDPETKIRNVLYNADRNERITISSDTIIYETLKYTSFSKIKPVLEKIILSLKDDYNIKAFNRIGLRYVNLIKLPVKEKRDIFEWAGYINTNLLFSNNFIKYEDILQQLQTVEFKLDNENDLLCRLQYGIPNRNMPADLMEKIFLIDIDGFTNSMVEQEDVEKILETIHEKSISIFENCIDDKLRNEMNGK